jgi:hypothetical protein
VISLCLPSRGRPDQLREMWRGAVEMAADPSELELVVRVDDDDRGYDALRSSGSDARVSWVVGPRATMSSLWNDAAENSHGDILAHMGDDVRFRTPGWDRRVADAFASFPPDRIGLVYGCDGVHNERLATHAFLSREWVKVVGYMLPPYFSCDWADQWNFDVSGLIGRRIFLPDVLMEHMHPAVGKGPLDQTHRERLERDRNDNNTARWQSLQGRLREDAEILLEAMR